MQRRDVREFLARSSEYKKQVFDTILLSDILNYINYGNVITLALRYLKKNGRIIISNMAGAGISAHFHEDGVKSNRMLRYFLKEKCKLYLETADTVENDCIYDEKQMLVNPERDFLVYVKK